ASGADTSFRTALHIETCVSFHLRETILSHHASLLSQHHDGFSLRAVVKQTAGVRFMAPALFFTPSLAQEA
ncbi:MAG: hypothetical protein ACXV3E_08395, partial [Halobacteriota archaeon]